MQGGQTARSKAYSIVRRRDEGRRTTQQMSFWPGCFHKWYVGATRGVAQRSRWTFYLASDHNLFSSMRICTLSAPVKAKASISAFAFRRFSSDASYVSITMGTRSYSVLPFCTTAEMLML